MFDHPDRSLRARITKKNARTATNSHFFRLNDEHERPRVTPGDDAEEAWWFTVEEIRKMRNQMLEDHPDQVDYWVARIDR